MFNGLDVFSSLWPFEGTFFRESPDSAVPLGRPSGGDLEAMESEELESLAFGSGRGEEIDVSIKDEDKGGKIWSEGERLIEARSFWF